MVALSLAGSAILLFSCEDASAGAEAPDDPALMTEYCEDLTVVMSQNGRRWRDIRRRANPIASSARG